MYNQIFTSYINTGTAGYLCIYGFIYSASHLAAGQELQFTSNTRIQRPYISILMWTARSPWRVSAWFLQRTAATLGWIDNRLDTDWDRVHVHTKKILYHEPPLASNITSLGKCEEETSQWPVTVIKQELKDQCVGAHTSPSQFPATTLDLKVKERCKWKCRGHWPLSPAGLMHLCSLHCLLLLDTCTMWNSRTPASLCMGERRTLQEIFWIRTHSC